MLTELVDMPVVDEAMLLDEAALGEWGTELAQRLNQKSEASVSYTVSVKGDDDSNQFGLLLDKRLHGLTTTRY